MARDFFPELTEAEVLEAFRTAGKDLAAAQRIVSATSADISSANINEMSAFQLRRMLWETLSAKNPTSYPTAFPFERRTRTVGKFRFTC